LKLSIDKCKRISKHKRLISGLIFVIIVCWFQESIKLEEENVVGDEGLDTWRDLKEVTTR
jgi:hypothetical protein